MCGPAGVQRRGHRAVRGLGAARVPGARRPAAVGAAARRRRARAQAARRLLLARQRTRQGRPQARQEEQGQDAFIMEY